MRADADEQRELAAAISGVLRAAGHDTEDGPAMLMGYALIAEWKAPDGVRWLTESHADAVGDPLPEWTTAGYYTSGLDGFPRADEDDDDDD